MVSDIEIRSLARSMVGPGKGILAIDESNGTCNKRLAAVGAAPTEESRRRWRELLITTEGIESGIAGAILYDETLRQSDRNGVPFSKILDQAGISPGIKVDTGAHPLAGHPDETVTEGLDGLRDRLSEYARMGAVFCKWRAVIVISGSGLPSSAAVTANAHALARYARLCQEAGLVPIVEPEVLMTGAHGIAQCEAVTRRTLEAVFIHLREQGVQLDGIVLKPSMVLPGSSSEEKVSPHEVARATLEVLGDLVPASVPGVAFLSGGQSDEDATTHLRRINELAGGDAPWRLTFSYGRALQREALETWAGDDAHWSAAQAALARRVLANSAASLGRG